MRISVRKCSPVTSIRERMALFLRWLLQSDQPETPTMLKTVYSTRGMFVAPHHQAAQAGRDVLKDGGNAVEAMVAAAASIATLYPHMNSIGGDGFSLVHEPGKKPVAIDACGRAAMAASTEFYRGHAQIPDRGPLAALTSAGRLATGAADCQWLGQSTALISTAGPRY
ncbi:MAG: gamma-glutamyltranspeptidase [Marinobacter psychrophilus]|jgi:gamma-glutamyltranspeptidase